MAHMKEKEKKWTMEEGKIHDEEWAPAHGSTTSLHSFPESDVTIAESEKQSVGQRKLQLVKDLNVSIAILFFIGIMATAAAALGGTYQGFYSATAKINTTYLGGSVMGTLTIDLGWQGFCIHFTGLSDNPSDERACSQFSKGNEIVTKLCEGAQVPFNQTTIDDIAVCRTGTLTSLETTGGGAAAVSCVTVLLVLCIWLQGYSDDDKRQFWASSVVASAMFMGSLLTMLAVLWGITLNRFGYEADLWLGENIKFVPVHSEWAVHCLQAAALMLLAEVISFTLLLHLGAPY